MPPVSVYASERMQQVEHNQITNAEIIDGHLYIRRYDQSIIDVGLVSEGGNGLSAYEVAVEEGFVGTVEDWLNSLIGETGPQGPEGPSAYAVAVTNGFVGNQVAWLASLVGAAGADGDDGATGPAGDSAYEVAVTNGFVGTEAEWLASLHADADDVAADLATLTTVVDDLVLSPVNALGTTTGTINLDMAALNMKRNTVALTGDPTFTTSNRAAGQDLSLKISAGGSARTLVFPAWIWMGAAAPTSLASGKVGMLSVVFYDDTDAGAVASWTVQPTT